MIKPPLPQNVEPITPPSSVQSPLNTVCSLIPNPTVSSEVEILQSKLQFTRLAEHLALRDRYTLRTLLRTNGIRIEYLQETCNVIRSERNCLLTNLSQVKAERDLANSQLTKSRSEHACIKSILEKAETALHDLRLEHDKLKDQSSESKKAEERNVQALLAENLKNELEMRTIDCRCWRTKYEKSVEDFKTVVASRKLERTNECEKLVQLSTEKDEIISTLQEESKNWHQKYDEAVEHRSAVKSPTDAGYQNQKYDSFPINPRNTAGGNLISPAPLDERTPRDIRSESKSRLTGRLPFSLCEDDNGAETPAPPDVVNGERPRSANKRTEPPHNGQRERSKKRTRLAADERLENERLEGRVLAPAKEKARCIRELVSLGSSVGVETPVSNEEVGIAIPAENGLSNGRQRSSRAGNSTITLDVVGTRANRRSEPLHGDGASKTRDSPEPRRVTRKISHLSNDKLLPAKAPLEKAPGSHDKKQHEEENGMALRNKEGATAKLPKRSSLRKKDMASAGEKTKKTANETIGDKSTDGDIVKGGGRQNPGRALKRRNYASLGDEKERIASTAERLPSDRNGTRKSGRSLGENENSAGQPRSRPERECSTKASEGKRSQSLANVERAARGSVRKGPVRKAKLAGLKISNGGGRGR